MRSRVVVVLFLLGVFGCQSGDRVTNSVKKEKAPSVVSLLEKGLISTPQYERDIAISPDGQELIYTLGDFKQNRRCLVSLQKNEATWMEPKILSFSGKWQDIEPFYSPDGKRLYFASNRPIFDDTTRTDFNIWYSDRADGKWGDPIALDSLINTKGNEFYPSVSSTGNLYFTATREGGIGREDIFVAENVGGKFTSPKHLPEAINTRAFEFNAYISPDENLIIFSSFGRADGLGGGDLYYSRKDKDGHWTSSKNMGDFINSTKLDYCPFIDWSTKTFYFTSERIPKNDRRIHDIEDMRSMTNEILNGFGNIYHVSLDALKMLDKE